MKKPKNSQDSAYPDFPPYGEEHHLFRKSVEDFVKREIIPNISIWEKEGALPPSFFELCGSLGYLGIRFSSQWGGQGLDFWYTVILVEELIKCGSVGVCVSLMAHCEFSSAIIELHGSRELKEEFLRPAIQGKKIGALGLTEPGAGSDLASLKTKAVRQGDHYILSGQKTFITNGTIGDFITAAVRTGGEGRDGISLVVIPTNAKGYSAKRLKKTGAHATDTAEVFLDDVEVPSSYLIGEENHGFSYILQGFTAERLILSIICYTQMKNMMKEAITYGRERKCFGNTLLDFQFWKYRLADLESTIEAAKALTYRAIDKFVKGWSSHREAAMAKLFSAEAMPAVSHTTRQIFGGYSVMEESKIARLALDSLGFSIGAGTSEMMREIISRGW